MTTNVVFVRHVHDCLFWFQLYLKYIILVCLCCIWYIEYDIGGVRSEMSNKIVIDAIYSS